jgi:hypothetical protein
MPEPPRKQSKQVSRREFAREVAAAAAAAAIYPASALATPEEAAAPPQTPGETTPLTAAAQAEVEAKYRAILRRYGSRLTEDQKKDVHRLLVEGQPSLEKLRAFPLANGDEPATVFVPYRAASPGRRAARKER